ncbi:Pentatricopeptide repeat-containing protein [Apostasia shenzhenica]|uniref:Pentatricopeptide repeat-containing protein n=1 Tax=Apostasia shenzhenica TaxID=1088818 RepID=A0A2I0AZL6_9ASPA|nr:Pentatricopeptide repeat-containing protein [Apostasia shenzhenica]
MNFLCKCLSSGQVGLARKLFDEIPYPDLRTVTLMLSAYSKHGRPKQSIELYGKLCKEKDLHPDRYVLLSVAKACALTSDPIKARDVHNDAIRFGLASDLLVGNCLIDMYGKCGFSEGARWVFRELRDRDVITWTSLISALSNCKQFEEALRVFREMLRSKVSRPNSFTLCTVLPVLGAMKAIKFGEEVHCFALRNGFQDDVFVLSAVMDVYAKSSKLQLARNVFDVLPERDAVSWNVMLSAYFSNNEPDNGLELFEQMENGEASTNCASWNCVISGLTQEGRFRQSVELFARMQHSKFRPNPITIASVLPACSHMENVRGGREIHGCIYRYGYTDDKMVNTALIFMYAKCGDLVKSRWVFNKMLEIDIVAWNAIIFANSIHGCSEEALSLYDRMIGSGMKPNSATFMSVLLGCSHSHLVEHGRKIFNSMTDEYQMQPDSEHYSCMVDILSRAGCLQEAYELIQTMPLEATASSWGALLAACRVYKNVELGKISAEKLFEIEPENPGNYLILSNILAREDLWDEASKIRRLMRDRGIKKVSGRSWIQVKNKTYTFVKGDDQMVQRDMIYCFLEEMGKKMRADGYKPDTDFVLQNVEGEEKEEALCSHSERLAIAFGALNLNGESVIRVFKNLRICGDCHIAIKFMSKILGVDITVRDNLRFHHFRDGSCSCNDLW